MSRPLPSLRCPVLLALLAAGLLLAANARAQQPASPGGEEVLGLLGSRAEARALPQDRGAVGLWQKLQKLRTTGSVLHTVAHPDDEHGGMLAYMSRGVGARTALLALNRGEGGANAIGSELFDALGLVRTEELLTAGAYYGLDDLYFTTMIDYGFSKNLEEAYRNWGHENVLRDVVRVIRRNRPFVVVARFHGSERDGHGHHQAAGRITQEAVRLSGDPTAFPEQITDEGLRPWTPLKTYRGGLREAEPWTLALDVGAPSPWLGTSYRNFASEGLAFQRSQVNGIYRETVGPQYRYYERLVPEAAAGTRETGFFDGLDTSLSGLPTTLGEEAPADVSSLLGQAERQIDEAIAGFDVSDPAAVATPLTGALRSLREALALLPASSEAAFHLRIKERQLQDAITTALGVRLTAVALPSGAATPESPWAPLPTMGVVVPGGAFHVDATLLNPSAVPVEPVTLRLQTHADLEAGGGALPTETLADNAAATVRFDVAVPETAPVSDRYFFRRSIRESRYELRDPNARHRPHRHPALVAVATYRVAGEPVTLQETVRTREARFPFGYALRELKVAPAVAVNLQPELRVVPRGSEDAALDVEVELVYNAAEPGSGTLALELPAGWRAEPADAPFSFTGAGERSRHTFRVTAPPLEQRDYELRAVATMGGRRYARGYDVIVHEDTDVNHLYRDATMLVRGIDVATTPGLRVGYVMGVGDEVPSALEQLGAEVTLLGAKELASSELSTFDAILVGTRAYAVRPDLLTYNRRLLDYAAAGGHLVVLYQTPEFVPGEMAPHPATLPRNAEEVSEEDAPVRILAPEHRLLSHPNRITEADFADWVEQRGSKFFATWDGAYQPLVEMNDHGQEPQRGVWLTAPLGVGTYTYCALALHRQTPYGVPGAYRILANLLALEADGGS